MKKLILILSLIIYSNFLQSQVISGNCNNGFGVYIIESYNTKFKNFQRTGCCVYVGNFKNGKAHGTGVMFRRNGQVNREGKWVKGKHKTHFKSNYTYPENIQKYGCIIGDCKSGFGVYKWESGNKYSGNWQQGKQHGKGTFTWSSGEIYSGDWKNGTRIGQGTYYYANGNRYTGDFINGKKTGKCVFYYSDGTVYEGTFNNSNFEGKGKMYWSNGESYEGNFRNGKRNGHGLYTWPSGNKYIGNWENGEKTGNGTLTWISGSKYVGNWKNSKMDGSGIKYDKDGYIIYKGIWKNDKLYSGGFYWRGKKLSKYKDGQSYSLNNESHINQKSKNTTPNNTDETFAKYFANKTANKLMRKISPNTGYGAWAIVKSYKYDSYNKSYNIKMKAYWSAGITMAHASLGDYRLFYIEGTLSINKDGTDPYFNREYADVIVRAAESFKSTFSDGSLITLGAIALVGIAVTSSSSTSNSSSYSSNSSSSNYTYNDNSDKPCYIIIDDYGYMIDGDTKRYYNIKCKDGDLEEITYTKNNNNPYSPAFLENYETFEKAAKKACGCN